MTDFFIQPLGQVLIVLGYIIIGGGLKYIDQVYDVHVFSKRLAYVFSVVCGLLMGFLIAFDEASAVILLSIIVGEGIARKIDNISFSVVMFLSLVIPLLFYVVPVIEDYDVHFSLLPFFLLVISGILDEFIDDIGDRRKIRALTIRPLMKVMVLALTFFGFFHFIYFIAFIGFDLAYIAVNWYSYQVIGAMNHITVKSEDIVIE